MRAGNQPITAILEGRDMIPVPKMEVYRPIEAASMLDPPKKEKLKEKEKGLNLDLFLACTWEGPSACDLFSRVLKSETVPFSVCRFKERFSSIN